MRIIFNIILLILNTTAGELKVCCAAHLLVLHAVVCVGNRRGVQRIPS